MPRRMNDTARLGGWKNLSTNWLLCIWKKHKAGSYVFIGTRDAFAGNWQEHPFQTPVAPEELYDFFEDYPRKDYDLYFCANAFRTSKRRAKDVIETRFACVDIDDALPETFEPNPTFLWETSPERFQGIWVYNRKLDRIHAEQIARNLAYKHGADKNGWSVTKYLRVPGTFNHKPDYDQPKVRIILAPSKPFKNTLKPPAFVSERSSQTGSKGKRKQSLSDGVDKSVQVSRQQVLRKYGRALPLMPRSFLGHERLSYPDRSAAIFVIVDGLWAFGASRNEIEAAVRGSIYFIDKYGTNETVLHNEVDRILAKLEG